VATQSLAGQFNTGIDAAKIAEKNKIEIDDVFTHLNQQLNAVTGGKIEIKRTQFREIEKNPALNALATWFASPTYWALGAVNQLHKVEAKELAKWSQDRAGYPCKIKVGKDEFVCENKSALEQALAYVLQDPVVGEILFTLMNYKPTEQN
jgi:hypothetical protein